MLLKKGYVIKKSTVNNELIDELKKDLTVVPHLVFNKNIQPESFTVYTEDDENIYIPKFFGIKKFGQPAINKELEGKNINIIFNGKLRENQLNIINTILPKIENNDGGLLSLGCGEGKCLGINTQIMLFDGTTKKVQDIQIGDKLMGDNLLPRNVLSICSGVDMMFKIIDKLSNESYIVNKAHILSLKYTSKIPLYYDNKIYNENDILDINIIDYINNKNELIEFHGYRLPILNLSNIETITDPYLYGLSLNVFNLNIDIDYKFNSLENRIKLAKGILNNEKLFEDMNYSNLYYIKVKINSLLQDIIWLFRSIGSIVYKISECTIIIIFYDNINKYDHLTYKFDINLLDNDNYYGFEIDDNKHFMLGDFTITHNTVLSLYIASLLKKKTLVIVHKEFLLNQWKQRAIEFTNAKIGLIQRDKIDIEDKDIVIGMLQSIAKDKYSSDIFKDFGLVIFDEAHHAPSKYFSRALPMISCKKTLALSATPKRSDRLEKVLYWYFGDILYKAPIETLNSVLVKIYKYNSSDKHFKEYKQNYGKDVNRAKTLNKLTEIPARNKFIISIIKELLIEDERRLLILSDRIDHLKILKKIIDELNITTTSYYIGGLKQKILDEAEKAHVIFASYSMASEALDIPVLNTLLMITPRKEIEQAIGRITRKKDHPVQPVVIDIVDQLPSFSRQGTYRRQFYNKKDFKIKLFEVEEDKIINEVNYELIKEPIQNDSVDIDFID
jgi:superfamily II DNA or RNA helicase